MASAIIFHRPTWASYRRAGNTCRHLKKLIKKSLGGYILLRSSRTNFSAAIKFFTLLSLTKCIRFQVNRFFRGLFYKMPKYKLYCEFHVLFGLLICHIFCLDVYSSDNHSMCSLFMSIKDKLNQFQFPFGRNFVNKKLVLAFF